MVTVIVHGAWKILCFMCRMQPNRGTVLLQAAVPWSTSSAQYHLFCLISLEIISLYAISWGPRVKLAIGHRPPCKLIQSNTATPNRFLFSSSLFFECV